MAYSKYGAKPVVTADGQRFDSQREYARWRDLALLAYAGKIRMLERQVRFPLHAPNGQTVSTYVADFTYVQQDQSGRWIPIVEDCKGVRTHLYRLKAKWMWMEHGIRILET